MTTIPPSSHRPDAPHRGWSHQRSGASLRDRWAPLGLVFLAGIIPFGELQAFTITRASSPVFYIDTSVTPTLQGMYAAYQINNNSGISYPDLWVHIDSFTGGSVALGPFEDGLVHLGSLAPGETKTAFFHLQASLQTTTPQTHTVHLHPTRPPAGELASQSFSMTVEETIQANANQVETVVAGPNPPQLGGLVTVAVRGRTGTVGTDGILAFNPAAYLSWRPDAYELVGTSITLSGLNAGTYTDTLYLIAGASQNTVYDGVYSYRTVGATQTATPVSPISFISSGTQIKHTRVENYAQFDPILPADNRMTLGKGAQPVQVSAGGPVTFTLTLTNMGTIETIVEDFTDTLPALPGLPTFVSGSARYGDAPMPDPLIQGSRLTWIGTFAIPPGATRSLTFQVNLPPANGVYTNLAVAHIGTTQIDTTLTTLDHAPASATVTLRIPIVSGFAYQDTNRNLQRDQGEPGTGLTLFAKLVAEAIPSGPALRAAPVDPAAGSYAFTNVPPGNYLIILDDSAALSDVTPTVPAGWIGTEMPGQIRTNVIVTTTDLPNQNFGLLNGTPLTGQVFQDTGAGDGTAHDGTPNGTEPGIDGILMRLTDATGALTLDTTRSGGNGQYELFLPASLADGTTLQVVASNPSGFLSVSGSAGNTGGTYDRTADTVTFAVQTGTIYTNVNFGDVPPNRFLPDNQQAGLPGGFVVFPHTFIAGSAGQVSFVSSNQPNPAVPGWTQVLYRDLDCNGQLDPADPLIQESLNLNAGDRVCILVKESIPAGAPFNARDTLTVTAAFLYPGTAPPLTAHQTVTDLATVGSPTTAGLTLVKSADKATAKPGEIITYTITYSNTSSEELQNIVLYDVTPAYTTFLSATNGLLPANISSVLLNAPSPGSTGSIRWTFSGALAPGRSGSVSFQVALEQ